MSYISMHSPIGDLTIFEAADKIVAIDWGWVPDAQPSPLLEEAKRQLDAYFDGDLQSFDLPLDPGGTTFQRRVWDAMAEIPYGQVRYYGDVAKSLGSGPRAVGGACGANPIPILIPCHRILAAGGKWGGYSGFDKLNTKKFLLGLEGWEPPAGTARK